MIVNYFMCLGMKETTTKNCPLHLLYGNCERSREDNAPKKMH